MDAPDPRTARVASLLPGLAGAPTLWPQALDLPRRQALLIEVERGFYADAVFLDERALRPGLNGAWVPLPRLEEALAGAARQPCRFVFHLGRAGSTLLSRLLDELPGVRGLREPLALRPLAVAASTAPLAPDEARALAVLHALYARRYPDEGAVVVKASSIAGVLAADLLEQHADDRAVALTVGLRAHLANALDKPPGADLEGFAALRGASLAARVAGFTLRVEAEPLARKAALSWLAGMVALAPLRGDRRVLFTDFDALLADRERGLAAVLAQLGLPVAAAPRLAASAAFGRYSKDPSVGFDPVARRRAIEASAARHRAAIEDAVALIGGLAARHPEVAAAVGPDL